MIKKLTELYGPAVSEGPALHCSDDSVDERVYWEGLSVGFKDGEFVAYKVSSSESPTSQLRTEKGIGIDSTLEDMKAAYPGAKEVYAEGPAYGLKTDGGIVRFFYQPGDVILPTNPDGTHPVKRNRLEAGERCLYPGEGS